MRLSVIIPVFRVEQTLCRCVDSIVEQLPDDAEVILVDDGSPDSCPQICDEYARKDRRIKTIHRLNGGLGAARNTGIEHSEGQHLMFADSDDFIMPDTIGRLTDMAEHHPEYDMIEFPVIKQYDGNKQRLLVDFKDEVFDDMRDYWLRCKAYRHTYACNKLFRREMFADVRFAEQCKFEDSRTMPLLLKKAKTIRTTSEGAYCYCHNPDSITSKADGQALTDLLDSNMEPLRHLLSEKDINDEEKRLLEEYYLYVLNIQLDVYETTGQQPVIPIMHGTAGTKLKMLNIFGLKTLCKLNKLAHLIYRRNRS